MAQETLGRPDYSPLAMQAMARVLEANAATQERPEDRAAKLEMAARIRRQLAQDKGKG